MLFTQQLCKQHDTKQTRARNENVVVIVSSLRFNGTQGVDSLKSIATYQTEEWSSNAVAFICCCCKLHKSNVVSRTEVMLGLPTAGRLLSLLEVPIGGTNVNRIDALKSV